MSGVIVEIFYRIASQCIIAFLIRCHHLLCRLSMSNEISWRLAASSGWEYQFSMIFYKGDNFYRWRNIYLLFIIKYTNCSINEKTNAHHSIKWSLEKLHYCKINWPLATLHQASCSILLIEKRPGSRKSNHRKPAGDEGNRHLQRTLLWYVGVVWPS